LGSLRGLQGGELNSQGRVSGICFQSLCRPPHSPSPSGATAVAEGSPHEKIFTTKHESGYFFNIRETST
jgi:hypothetical protein